MRIVSLVPAGTEIIAALGAERFLVGISHECDWPCSVTGLPRVTTTAIDSGGSSGRIDQAVRELAAAGRPVIAVNAAALVALRPDLVIVQDVCAVCAATDGGLCALTDLPGPAPRVVALGARTLEGIHRDIRLLGEAIGLPTTAGGLSHAIRDRLESLSASAGLNRPRVVCLEWLDPIFLAGHWVPELIRAAGGDDVGAAAGAHSVETTLEQVRGLAPDLVLVAPCGMDLVKARNELAALEDRERRVGRLPPSEWGADVWLLDGNAYTSRPGPRIAEAAELVAWAIGGVKRPGLARWPALRPRPLVESTRRT